MVYKNAAGAVPRGRRPITPNYRTPARHAARGACVVVAFLSTKTAPPVASLPRAKRPASCGESLVQSAGLTRDVLRALARLQPVSDERGDLAHGADLFGRRMAVGDDAGVAGVLERYGKFFDRVELLGFR